jgi:hypothetical protein
VPALIDIASNGSLGSRKSAVFWLGQAGDPRALATLHSVIENASEDERIRSHAIFALTHGDDIPASEFAWLRGIFPRLPFISTTMNPRPLPRFWKVRRACFCCIPKIFRGGKIKYSPLWMLRWRRA